MKLEEFKNKINEMYDKYGDIEVCFDFNTTDEGFYTFMKNDKIIEEPNTFDDLFIEEIVDVQETYYDVEMTRVSGICLSNYKQCE